MVPELHAMRIVCLLKAVTPAWVINTVSFTLQIDYIHHSGSFEVLQAKVKCHLSVRPARPVPRVLNKRYSARGGPINVSFMYITWGRYVNILGKFHDRRAIRWLFT